MLTGLRVSGVIPRRKVLRLYKGALFVVPAVFKADKPSCTFAKTFASIAVRKTMAAKAKAGIPGFDSAQPPVSGGVLR
jgi:hypothetical protein